jgi:hypothetical protein
LAFHSLQKRVASAKAELAENGFGSRVGQGERNLVARFHGKVAHRAHAFAAQRNGGSQHHQVRTGDGAHTALKVRHPGDGEAVVEADRAFHAHRHLATQPVHHPHHV